MKDLYDYFFPKGWEKGGKVPTVSQSALQKLSNSAIEEERKRKEEERKKNQPSFLDKIGGAVGGVISEFKKNPTKSIKELAIDTALMAYPPTAALGIYKAIPAPEQQKKKVITGVGESVIGSLVKPATGLEALGRGLSVLPQTVAHVATEATKGKIKPLEAFTEEYWKHPMAIDILTKATDKKFNTKLNEVYNSSMADPIGTGALAGLSIGMPASRLLSAGAITFFGATLAKDTPKIIEQIKQTKDPLQKAQSIGNLIGAWGMVAGGLFGTVRGVSKLPKTKVIPGEDVFTPVKKAEVIKFMNEPNSYIKPEVRTALEYAFKENPNLGQSLREGGVYSKGMDVTVPTVYGKVVNFINQKLGRGEQLTQAETVVANDMTTNPETYIPKFEPPRPSDLVEKPIKPITETPVKPATGELVEHPTEPIISKPIVPEEVYIPEKPDFTLEEVTEKTPMDLGTKQEYEMSIYNQETQPLENQLNEVKKQLKEIKGRSKETTEQRKLLSTKIDSINKKLVDLEEKFTNENLIDQMKLADVLVKEAQRQGLDLGKYEPTNGDIEMRGESSEEWLNFVDNMMMELYERPGIEYNWNKPVRDVVKYIVEDYKKSEAEYNQEIPVKKEPEPIKTKPVEPTVGANKGVEKKYVWMANKEGGQTVGNKQIIRKPSMDDFKKEILPRTRNGWYGTGTVEQQYKNMLKKEPDIGISFIDTGKGWEVSKIDGMPNLESEVLSKPQWSKEVTDFNSPEAVAHMNIFDSQPTVGAKEKPSEEMGIYKSKQTELNTTEAELKMIGEGFKNNLMAQDRKKALEGQISELKKELGLEKPKVKSLKLKTKKVKSLKTKEKGIIIPPEIVNTLEAASVWEELDTAMPGTRTINQTEEGLKVLGSKSTFPDWIPEGYRITALVTKVKDAMIDNIRPTGKAGELYDIAYQEILNRKGTGFSEDVNWIKKVKNENSLFKRKKPGTMTKGETISLSKKTLSEYRSIGDLLLGKNNTSDKYFADIPKEIRETVAHALDKDLNMLRKVKGKELEPLFLIGDEVKFETELYDRLKEYGGFYLDGVTYFPEKLSWQTYGHEKAHFIWDYFLTKEQRNYFTKKYMNRETYLELSEKDRQLAEESFGDELGEFLRRKLYKEAPEEISGKEKIYTFFEKLVDWIYRIFGKESPIRNKFDTFFEDMWKGSIRNEPKKVSEIVTKHFNALKKKYTDDFIDKTDADEPVLYFMRKSEGRYKVDEIIKETPDKEKVIARAKGALLRFKTQLWSQYAPLAKAEKILSKRAKVKKPKLGLDKRFELLAGAEGKAEADVYKLINVINRFKPRDYPNLVRAGTLLRIADRLKKDPERKKVGDWTIESAEKDLAQLKKDVGEQKWQKIETALKDYQELMNRALKLQVQSGRMKSEVYKLIKEENDFYAPFKVMKWYEENPLSGTGGKIATSQDFAKRITGIEDEDFQIGDIFQASSEQLVRSRILAEKNIRMLQLEGLLELDPKGDFVKKARPRRTFPVNYSSAEAILEQLSYQHQPLEQSFIKVGKAIQYADELGVELKRKKLPVNLGNATLGTAPGGRVNLRAFTSETVSHELTHIFDVKTEEVGTAFGQEYFKRISAMVRGEGLGKEMKAIIDYRKADASPKWKGKSSEKFAEFVQIYIHDPKKARELAPTFTDKFEKEILPNEQVKSLVEALSHFYQKVDGLPNIMTRLKDLDENYLELAIRRAFPERKPVFASIPESKARPGYQIVNYIKDGKDQALEIKDDIGQVLNGVQRSDTLVSKAFHLVKKPLRTAVILLNLSFQIVNPFFTDIPRAMIMSRYGVRPTDLIRFPSDFVYAFYTSLTGNFGHKNKLYMDFLNSGAYNSTLSQGLNPAAFKHNIRVRPLGVRAKELLNPAKTFHMTIDNLSRFSNVMEEITKLMGYKRGRRFEGLNKSVKELETMKKNGVSEEELAVKIKDINDRADILASEVRNFTGSPDFAKTGLSGFELNDLFMFFRTKLNEAVSDIARLGGKEGGAKASAGAWIRLTALIGIPTLYLLLRNHEPDKVEDYYKLSQFDRDNYYMIPRDKFYTDSNGQKIRDYWKIPKRAVMKTFSNIIESAGEYAYQHNPAELANLAFGILENTSPINIQGKGLQEKVESVIASMNPLIKAPVEFAMGRNTYFHSDTIPERLKYVSSFLQYRENTPETYKKLGAIFGVSPLLLEQLGSNLGAQVFTQFKPKKVAEGREGWTGWSVVSKFVRSQTSSDDASEKVLTDLLREKADVKQLEKLASGEENTPYLVSLYAQLNADEKEEALSKMTPEAASQLDSDYQDYRDKINEKSAETREKTGTSAAGTTKSTSTRTSSGRKRTAKTIKIGSLKMPTVRSVSKLGKIGKLPKIKKIKLIKAKVKKPRRIAVKRLRIG
jgi:hypothetical protein